MWRTDPLPRMNKPIHAACVFAALFIAISSSPTSSAISPPSDFIAEYFIRRHIGLVSACPCTTADGLHIMRALQQSLNPFLTTINREAELNEEYVENDTMSDNDDFTRLGAEIRTQGVFVDIQCASGKDIVNQAAQHSLTGGSIHWLLWSSHNPRNDAHLTSFLEKLPLNVDAEVVLAFPQDDLVGLLDLYKVKAPWILSMVPVGDSEWTTKSNTMSRLSTFLANVRNERKNLQGLQLRSAVVLHEVSADPQKNHEEFEAAITSQANRHLDSESRFGYALFKHLEELFNFTVDTRVTESWGYRINGTVFDGMVGMLQRGEVDVGVTPAIFNQQRLEVVDFTTPTWRLRTCFLFRHPRLLVPYKALAEPFVDTTWLVVSLLSVFVLMLLQLVQNIENSILGKEENKSWSVSLLVVVGVLAQQGSPTEPRLSSGRLILFTDLALSLILYAFYTSAIVTSLLTPVPRTIKTPEDLIRSPVVMGLEDYSYNRAVFPNSKDVLTSRIWREKVGKKGGGGFVKVTDGVRRMRKEFFALYSEDSTLYVPVEETFDDSEKCDLSEVELSSPSPTGAPLQKNSPFRELFNRGLLRMWEHGIRSRQRRLWSARKPQCLADATTTIAAVGLDPIFPAHGLLLAGLVLSITILFSEMWTGYKERRGSRSEESVVVAPWYKVWIGVFFCYLKNLTFLKCSSRRRIVEKEMPIQKVDIN